MKRTLVFGTLTAAILATAGIGLSLTSCEPTPSLYGSPPATREIIDLWDSIENAIETLYVTPIELVEQPDPIDEALYASPPSLKDPQINNDDPIGDLYGPPLAEGVHYDSD